MDFFLDRNYKPIVFGSAANGEGASSAHFTAVGKVLVAWAKNRSAWADMNYERFIGTNGLNATRIAEGDPGFDEDRNFDLYIPPIYKTFSIVQAADLPGQPPKKAVKVGDDQYEMQDDYSFVLNNAPAEVRFHKDGGGAEFMLRLPPAAQVYESEELVEHGADGYGPPKLYERAKASGIDLFYARVADYTMRGCR